MPRRPHRAAPRRQAHPGRRGSASATSPVDDYAWLRDRDDPDLLPLLEAENAHTDAVLAPQADLATRIYDEIKARTQETDLSVPHRKGGWWYYSRTVEGLAYAIHCRVPDDGTGPPDVEAGADPTRREQVLLDENVVAEGHDYSSLGVARRQPRRLAGWPGRSTTTATRPTCCASATSPPARTSPRPSRTRPTASPGPPTAAPASTRRSTRRSGRGGCTATSSATTRPTAADVLVHQEDDERFFVGVSLSRIAATSS